MAKKSERLNPVAGAREQAVAACMEEINNGIETKTFHQK